jgi:dCMP deaminase
MTYTISWEERSELIQSYYYEGFNPINLHFFKIVTGGDVNKTAKINHYFNTINNLYSMKFIDGKEYINIYNWFDTIGCMKATDENIDKIKDFVATYCLDFFKNNVTLIDCLGNITDIEDKFIDFPIHMVQISGYILNKYFHDDLCSASEQTKIILDLYNSGLNNNENTYLKILRRHSMFISYRIISGKLSIIDESYDCILFRYKSTVKNILNTLYALNIITAGRRVELCTQIDQIDIALKFLLDIDSIKFPNGKLINLGSLSNLDDKDYYNNLENLEFELSKCLVEQYNKNVDDSDLSKDIDINAEENNPIKYSNSKNIIDWESYFIGIAQLVKRRSKDPSCQVGACIVKDNRIISTGYNGFPRNCDDAKYPWSKGSPITTENKYFYVVHAELNAILNSKIDPNGSTIYVTKFPCNECAKAIIQCGIKDIVYIDNIPEVQLNKDKEVLATKNMLTDAKVYFRRYKFIGKSIVIDI